MAKNKTVETQASVEEYLLNIADDKKRNDCKSIIGLITQHSGLEPKMWGTSIVGFGIYHYKYENGTEGSAPLLGVASRANAITLYVGSSFEEREELLSKLGKFKMGKSCIHIQKLEDIDIEILMRIAKNSIDNRKRFS